MKLINCYLLLAILVVVPSVVLAQCNNCGVNDQCCNGRCYNPSTHSCINGVLCGKGQGVCRGNVCYNPQSYVCYPSPCYGYNQTAETSNDVLCGIGLAPCGVGNSK